MQTHAKSFFFSRQSVTCWGQMCLFTYSPWANTCHILISTISGQTFLPSFVLPLMLRSVSIKLSHIFFSTYITSRQYVTSRLEQYGRSKSTNLFFHIFFFVGSFCSFLKTYIVITTTKTTLKPSILTTTTT